MFQLAKINKQAAESAVQNTEVNQADKPQNTDLSAYVLSYTWSGDVEQAGRKLEFDLAYTTKDKDWTNAVLELGDEVCFSYTDDVTQETFPVFQGRVFSRSRDSESYAMRFVAFDSVIYLAKSRITRKYANVTVADAIRQTIHDFNIEAGTMPDLSVVCSFIADDISATDAIKQALSYQSTQDGKGYHIYMTDGKLNVVCTNDQVVENFLISDETNLTGASVSESIEDMVSKVVVVDSAGQTKGEMPNTTDIEKFGIIQAICKADPKQDDASQARAMLKTVAHDMSVHALGHIQCIAGFSVDIQEDGTVYVGGTGESVEQAVERIQLIIKVPEPGEEYTGRVVSIQPFGAFVSLLPGKDGLLHISRVAQGRVDKVEDVLNVGDEVKVRVLEVDERGKISLDRIDKPEAPAGSGNGGGEGERRERSDRPRRNRSERSDRPRRAPGDNGGRTPRRHHEG